MATNILSEETGAVVSARKAVPLQDLVETLANDALAQAQQKMSTLQRGADLRTRLGDPAFLDIFKYALTCGIARILIENAQFIQAVYTYDPSTNPDSESGEDLPTSATVHLLVQVSK